MKSNSSNHKSYKGAIKPTGGAGAGMPHLKAQKKTSQTGKAKGAKEGMPHRAKAAKYC